MAKKSVEKVVASDVSTFVDYCKTLLGQRVAVLCSRYNYRGILSNVCDECLILANACAVERSGPCSGDHPVTEDAVGGSIAIKYAAIEIVFQPNWVNAPLPGNQ